MIAPGREERGFTFVEILITLVFISIALLAVTSQFPVGLQISETAEDITIETNLAQELLEEIRSLPWKDPNPFNDGNPLGPDPGEFYRTTHFNDVDDYHGLVEPIPVDLYGNDMDGTGGRPNFSKYSRDVTVTYADTTTLEVSAVQTPYKRIEVGVLNVRTDLRTALVLIVARQP